MRVATVNRNRQSKMNSGYDIKIEVDGAVSMQQGVFVPEHSLNEFSVSDINFINPIAFSIYNGLAAQGLTVPHVDIVREITRYITNGTKFGGRYIKIAYVMINNGNANFKIFVR